MSYPYWLLTWPPLATVIKVGIVIETSTGKFVSLVFGTWLELIVIARPYWNPVGCTVNVAVTLTGPFIVTLCGVEVPLRPPLKPENV
jgi:hypothetical protein